MTEVRRGRQKRRIGKRISARRRKRAKLLLCLGLLCIAVVVIIFNISLYRYVKKFPADKIYQNIYVGNINVSNMTKKEAKRALENSLKTDQKIEVMMKVKDESIKVLLGELDIQCKNMDKAIKEAFAYGKEGSLFGRYRQIKRLEKKKNVYTKEHTVSSKKTKAVLNERADEFLTHAVDASIQKEGDTFKITKEKAGKQIDTKKAVQQITSHINNQWNHGTFSLKLELKEEKPKVTKTQLKSVKDEVAVFSTDAGSGARWQNLKVAVEKLNGIVLVPGEEISVQDVLSPFDAESGYVEAGSYENNQVVDSFGGGVCQVTTTLYNAVLYAELHVTERHPHSMLVDYVDPSRDAAIATGLLEFKFQNNYDNPILICAEIDNTNQLRFYIYGKETRAKGRTVEYESETLAKEDYEVKYQEDPEAPLGAMEYANAPYAGVGAQLWKIVKQDGVEQSREVINHSTYQKVDQIIKIGTKSESAGATAAVRQAIGSQKNSVIQQAIVNAKGLPQ